MAFDLFKRFRSAPVVSGMAEAKSVSLPELLLSYSRTAPIFQKWDTEVAVEQGLKASAIFFACVNRRATAIAQVPWKAYRVQADGKSVEAPDSPLQRLINKPNADFAWAEMMEYMSQHIDLAGNSYWSVIRAGNASQPVEIWPLLPQAVKIKAGRQRLIDYYMYQRAGVSREIQSGDMIHVKTVNPNDFLFGLPTIQAAGRAVDVDREAGQWQLNSMHNRGISDYAIIIDPDTSAEQIDRLKELHKDKQAGAKNARQPFLTTRDIKVLNQSAVEMDFIASRSKVWAEICSAMGVPQPMVGLLEDATLANIETARKIFWIDTMIPLLRLIRSQLNLQLASQFGPGWAIDFDTSGIEALREDYNKKLEEAQKLFSMGVPFNVINQKLGLGLDDIEGGNVGYLSAGLLPTDFDRAADPVSVQLAGLDPEMLKAMTYGRD
jgi:HK97 family phage portal protein